MGERTSQRKRLQYEQLAKLRMRRKTFAECSQELAVSERQLRRWASTPEYAQVWKEMEQEWVSTSRARVKDSTDLAIETLVEIMTTSRSALARVQAAKTIGQWAGLGQHETEQATDDREEVIRLLQFIQARKALSRPSVQVESVEGQSRESPSRQCPETSPKRGDCGRVENPELLGFIE